MPTKHILNSLPGEALVGISPPLLSRTDTSWHRRLNLFTGRALNEASLDAEQSNHSGLLALTAQMVSPGVVQGLQAMLDLSGAEPQIYITPGNGISADGEDVTLARAMRTPLSSIAAAQKGVILRDNTAQRDKTFADFKQDPANKTFAGVLVLQPVMARIVGTPDGPQDADLIADSCQMDVDQTAFEDWQEIDGCRLVFHAWPQDFVALPPSGPSWRNQIAYAIYAREASMRPGEIFPWEAVGVPVAIVAFDNTWKPLFIDRYAVVRSGGYPRRRSTTPDLADIQVKNGDFASPYNPFLAEARIHQFAEEFTETNPKSLAGQFRFLPPVGAVPVSAVDLHQRKNSLFPGNIKLTARPVHIEEIETILVTSAQLAPFDLTDLSMGDSIELLVPLPDGAYDPKVLVDETISPEFQDEINRAAGVRNDDLRHRKDLQLKANALLGVLGEDGMDIDADVSAEEKVERDKDYKAPADEIFSIALDDKGNPVLDDKKNFVSADITDLKKAAAAAPYTITIPPANNQPAKTIKLISDNDWKDLTDHGLEHFIQSLQQRVNKADDLIDLGFLRTQTDIYRYRQHLLNTVDASRLATSPILAQIAQGTTANATKEDLQKYLSDARKSGTIPPVTPKQGTPPPAGHPALTYIKPAANLIPALSFGGFSSAIATRVVPPPPPAPVVVPPPPPRVAAPAPIVRDHRTAVVAPPPPVAKLSSPLFGAALKVTATPVHVATPIHAATPVKTPAVVVPGGVAVGHPAVTIPPPATVSSIPSIPIQVSPISIGGIIFHLPPAPTHTGTTGATPSATDIHQQSPVPGAQLNFRTISIAERLQQPPSQEALFFATGNRVEMTALLADLEITVEDLPLIIDAENQTDSTKELQTDVVPLGSLKDSKQNVTGRILTPRMNADPDEAHAFATGIRVLEQHTALLRAIEGRIQQYRDFIALAQSKLTNINTTLTLLDSRLKQVEDSLTQSRHDLAFATALLEDEKIRVKGVNDGRAQAIDQYVKYIIFHRMATFDDSIAPPSRQLFPEVTTSAVPACLSRRVSNPPELHDMLALLREAPVAWMPDMATLVNRFDRQYLLKNLAVTITNRAGLRQAMPAFSSYAQYQSGVLPAAMSYTFVKQQNVIAGYRNARVLFDPAILDSETWVTQFGYVQSIASIGDLLDSEYAPSDITRSAAQMFQQLGGVAGCLYEKVGTLKPLFRLHWAEQLTDVAMHTDLHDLGVLKGWTDVDYLSRREIQSYVDWLFSRVAANNAEAHGYMSDLVRVCILLASHAPVDEIIHSEVIQAVPLNVGNVVRIKLPSTRVVRGTQVLMYSGANVAAHGVVQDLSDTEVSAHVVNVLSAGKVLKEQDHVQFVKSSIPLSGAIHLAR